MIGLGIDAGGSGTRWLLLGSDGERAAGVAAPLSGHLYTTERRAETREQLQQLAQSARVFAHPDAIVAGVTGLDHRGPEHAFWRATLATVFGVPERAVRVMHDTALAYRTAFAPGEGVLLYAGTGSVAYHQTAAGRDLRAGGHGYIIDDAGGGYFLGRQALRQIVRNRDERSEDAPSSRLETLIYEQIGGRSWDAMRAYVYGGGRGAVAALARAVAEAAGAGDETARQILEEAGGELARLARILLARVGATQPVGFAGGVSRIGGVLEATLRRDLPGVRLFVVDEEPVVAAARLALEPDELSS